MNTTATRLRSLGAVLLLIAGLGLAGCSSDGSDEASSDSGSTAMDAPQQAQGAAESDAGSGATARTADVARVDDSTAAPAIIQTGTMTVQSADVAQARFDLGKVVDAHDASIADEKTTAGDQGETRLSRVQLRVPSAEFDATLTDLATLGTVTASTRKAKDVTGEVIDTRARVQAQEQSLERVEVLFARAQSIRDIVAIEAQLSRRQADLDSLKGQLAYLDDQTTLSTITVYLEQAPETSAPEKEQDHNAFVAGLTGGWHALSGLGTGLAALAGALLPFALVTLLLGLPAYLGARRWLARRPARRPAAEA